VRYVDVRGTDVTMVPPSIDCVVADPHVWGANVVYEPAACGLPPELAGYFSP